MLRANSRAVVSAAEAMEYDAARCYPRRYFLECRANSATFLLFSRTKSLPLQFLLQNRYIGAIIFPAG
jgi:hypothetical protein